MLTNDTKSEPARSTLWEERLNRVAKALSGLKTLLAAAVAVAGTIWLASNYYASATAEVKDYKNKLAALEASNAALLRRIASHDDELKNLKTNKLSGIKIVEYGNPTSWVRAEGLAECPNPTDKSGSAQIVVKVGLGNNPDVRVQCANVILERN